MRGEHSRPPAAQRMARGPSPRARGAPRHGVPHVLDAGTIPACAGSTRPARRTSWRAGDHPRVRGEHPPNEYVPKLRRGPSPRARGAPAVPGADPRARGTIPACAGSTRQPPRLPSTGRDHPRVRGEHPDMNVTDVHVEGPSPRARGARVGTTGGRLPAGTIPACAGSTCGGTGSTTTAWDHPRVRGEHASVSNRTRSTGGPSPRARGAPPNVRDIASTVGTIPACAGSTHRRADHRRRRGDHPRVRGEHHSSHRLPRLWSGPSPRARGAPGPSPPLTALAGTIPACAGSTGDRVRGGGRRQDHPRVRGEHLPNVMFAAFA